MSKQKRKSFTVNKTKTNLENKVQNYYKNT